MTLQNRNEVKGKNDIQGWSNNCKRLLYLAQEKQKSYTIILYNPLTKGMKAYPSDNSNACKRYWCAYTVAIKAVLSGTI